MECVLLARQDTAVARQDTRTARVEPNGPSYKPEPVQFDLQ